MAITICSIDDWHQVEKLVEQISSFLKLYQYISNAHILVSLTFIRTNHPSALTIGFFNYIGIF